MGLNITIDEELTRLINARVQSGQYESASDVVQAALWEFELSRTLETDESKLAWLRAAVAEGDASGDAGPFDVEQLLEEVRRSAKTGG